MSTPTIDQLKRAIGISEQIEKLQAELAAIFGGRSVGSVASVAALPTVRKKGKRMMSAEARERIAAAQRLRWAKAKGEKPAAAAKPAKTGKKKRNLSPEGRARIAAAQKARWAARKAS
jgi:hypothetical protein